MPPDPDHRFWQQWANRLVLADRFLYIDNAWLICPDWQIVKLWKLTWLKHGFLLQHFMCQELPPNQRS